MKTQLFLVGALSLAIAACSSDSPMAKTDASNDFLKQHLNQHHQFQTDYSIREKAEAQRALRQPRNKHKTEAQENGVLTGTYKGSCAR